MPTLATSLLLIVLAIPSLAQRCTSQTITVNVNAITSILNLQEPANQKSLTDFVQQSTSPTLNFPATLIQGTQPLSKSYIISGKLCVPAQGVRKFHILYQCN
ncbi:hypothetical protein SISNIDRAFT_134013 [Sistotremastrum niveocremeum HHB9708]|uniref:Uncharacterized protein n=1 Tax=Sistotremastrum niveocremeum HHB9708 TaxID=1314777 RepID=A0A164ZWG9_9AGAM|nr:hypothetical protein SISNIDRAFT_134013 [Sistotremastrum niveocremeum HHB9708]